MRKRIVVAVGGTGGHLFPAMAFAETMQARDPAVEFLFVGGGLKGNSYFDRTRFPFEEVACARLPGKKISRWVPHGYQILRGTVQSYRLLCRFTPHVVLGFGSYTAFPPLLAARLARVPIVLHEGNLFPGKVNRLFSRLGALSAVHFPETDSYLRGPSTPASMPLRSGLQKGRFSRQEAARYFSLSPDRLTLLLLGGSQGALALNRFVLEAVRKEGERWRDKVQFLHFTGQGKETDALTTAYRSQGLRACVKPFEAEMGYAWELADLTLMRAGASSLAEAIAFGVPQLLVPYPYAADRHQEKNAEFMVNTVQGALMALERELQGESLFALIEKGFAEKERMREALCSYKKESCSEDLCALVERYL